MEKTLYIFDFDDTLITSEARVVVNHEDGSHSFLNGMEFANYERRQGDEFDFSDFEIYPPQGKVILPIFKRLQFVINNEGLDNVAVVSARLDPVPIRQFLIKHGMPKELTIAAVGSIDQDSKGKFVHELLKKGNQNHVHVFEDNFKNIESIKKTCKRLGIGCTHTLIVTKDKGEDYSVGVLRDYIKEMIRSIKYKTAGIVVVKKHGKEYKVLGLRLGNSFDLPKGRIEPGEDTFTAALRETQEEAGITQLNFSWGNQPISHMPSTLYLAETSQEPNILPNPVTGQLEHDEAVWLDWGEILENVYPYFKPALIQAKEILKSN